MGSAACASLHSKMSGRVLAVFRRTFYVTDTADGVVCVGDASLGAGPLNMTCGSLHNWRAEPLSPGDPARMDGGILIIGERLAFSLEDAETWQPSPPSFRGWPALRQGLRVLAGQAGCLAPTDGLGRIIPLLIVGESAKGPKPELSPVTEAAMRGVRALRLWLSGRMGEGGGQAEPPPPAVASLVGLGPGLTPSGDDFLGGVAVALHALGDRDAADNLADWLAHILPARTGLISRAHLRQALRGEASAQTLAAMDAVLSGRPDRVAAAARAAASIGHTSGWDTLSGLACAAATAVDAAARRGSGAPAARCA